MNPNTDVNRKPIVVIKYGGSSLANTDFIKSVAEQIVAKKDQGLNLVVVVSAMGKTTDHFVAMAHKLNPTPDRREMDMLVSVGERISIALMAMAINAIGKYQAVSYTGSQIGLITDDNHTQAQILEIKGYRLREALDQDKIVIIAGFQGVSIHKEITTLGRGGSDTTAVALAAALNADYCEIMSDIDGIYTADPKSIPTARLIQKIDYDQALEMASAGAKMLHKAAVELAKQHQVDLRLGSTFSGHIGTIVTNESLARNSIQGVVLDKDMVLLSTQANIPNLAFIISKKRIQVKLWQSVRGYTVIAVTKTDALLLRTLLQEAMLEENCAMLSIVGTQVCLGTKTAEQFLSILKEMCIDIFYLHSGEMVLKAVLRSDQAEAAHQKIHSHFFEQDK